MIKEMIPMKPRRTVRLVQTPRGRAAEIVISRDSVGQFYMRGSCKPSATHFAGTFRPSINDIPSERDMKDAEERLLEKMDKYFDQPMTWAGDDG